MAILLLSQFPLENEKPTPRRFLQRRPHPGRMAQSPFRPASHPLELLRAIAHLYHRPLRFLPGRSHSPASQKQSPPNPPPRRRLSPKTEVDRGELTQSAGREGHSSEITVSLDTLISSSCPIGSASCVISSPPTSDFGLKYWGVRRGASIFSAAQGATREHTHNGCDRGAGWLDFRAVSRLNPVAWPTRPPGSFQRDPKGLEANAFSSMRLPGRGEIAWANKCRSAGGGCDRKG